MCPVSTFNDLQQRLQHNLFTRKMICLKPLNRLSSSSYPVSTSRGQSSNHPGSGAKARIIRGEVKLSVVLSRPNPVFFLPCLDLEISICLVRPSAKVFVSCEFAPDKVKQLMIIRLFGVQNIPKYICRRSRHRKFFAGSAPDHFQPQRSTTFAHCNDHLIPIIHRTTS